MAKWSCGILVAKERGIAETLFSGGSVVAIATGESALAGGKYNQLSFVRQADEKHRPEAVFYFVVDQDAISWRNT
ncbi:hypothetical protein LOY69_09725 [Pseudomonas sp. B21-059]|uniref:hypothetical protein n=1 Tax=Pseudomonas sp. B21-059 TaxID=2895496 RepID=UPI0022344552|nr:hypothetical protein [Pseudomonas sp. B21-059]UZE36763.1 hypothetical protein LOY69_09725 [Pseudomonas sp. B21-059]